MRLYNNQGEKKRGCNEPSPAVSRSLISRNFLYYLQISDPYYTDGLSSLATPLPPHKETPVESSYV